MIFFFNGLWWYVKDIQASNLVETTQKSRKWQWKHKTQAGCNLDHPLNVLGVCAVCDWPMGSWYKTLDSEWDQNCKTSHLDDESFGNYPKIVAQRDSTTLRWGPKSGKSA